MFDYIFQLQRLVIFEILKSVGIARLYSEKLRAGWPGLDSRYWQETFLISTALRPTPGPIQPHVHWVPGAPSLGAQWPGCDADHSLPSSVQVKNCGAIPPLPHTSS
jgi:hypothetical protein